jgi:uncharacterized Zn-finger protein
MSFIQLKNLKAHLFKHTNEYPYSCDLCGKGFVCQSALQRHNHVHTGERPSLCKVCEKSFTQVSNLNYHQRVHTCIKREATDTQQEQQNSAVAKTFPEIKAQEKVSYISLYPLLFR